jgi:hypothetical protein
MNRKCLICGFRKDQIDVVLATLEIDSVLLYLMCQIQAISICLELLEPRLITLSRSDGIQMSLVQEHRGHAQFLPRADAHK